MSSPSRYSRPQEEQDLQNLIDRLVCYMEEARILELENSCLTRMVNIQETSTQEVSDNMYEHELSDARKLLDEKVKEHAKLEIDTKRLWDDNKDLKSKLEKKTKDLQTERNVMIYETRCSDLELHINQCETECKKLGEKNRDSEINYNRMKALLDDARKHLEEETLQRIDLENNIQSLKEHISFKDQVHQQELAEAHTKRQVEISERDGRLAEQYQAKLQQSLQELRDQHEAQMRANREKIELLYENKIKNLASHAQRNSDAANLAVEELRQIGDEFERLKSRLRALEAANDALNTQKRDLENLQENDRARYTESLAGLEAELARMLDERAQQMQEYQDLMGNIVALDLEVAAYRKMFESDGE